MRPMNSVSHDRYLDLIRWARARYTVNGLLVTHTFNRKPTLYSRIESAAWDKYMVDAGYSTKCEAHRDAGIS